MASRCKRDEKKTKDGMLGTHKWKDRERKLGQRERDQDGAIAMGELGTVRTEREGIW